MPKRSQKHDHVDFDKLLDLVHEVEDLHNGSIVEATDHEMREIWELTQPGTSKRERHWDKVTVRQYAIIEQYAAKRLHTSAEKEITLALLHKKYSWLNGRVQEYRRGRLSIER